MPCDEVTSEGLVGSNVFVYLMLASVYYGVEILMMLKGLTQFSRGLLFDSLW